MHATSETCKPGNSRSTDFSADSGVPGNYRLADYQLADICTKKNLRMRSDVFRNMCGYRAADKGLGKMYTPRRRVTFGNGLHFCGMPGAEGFLEVSHGCFLLVVDRRGAPFVMVQARLLRSAGRDCVSESRARTLDLVLAYLKRASSSCPKK